MKKVKEKEAPDLSSLLIFGYACKLFRCLTFATAVLLAMSAELSLNAVDGGSEFLAFGPCSSKPQEAENLGLFQG